MSFNYSYSSSSSSYSTSTSNGQTTGYAQKQTTHRTPEGTTVRNTHQNLGNQAVQETRHYDAQGRETLSGGSHSDSNRRIEDVTAAEKEAEAEASRRYDENIEDEYAKREGGA